MRKLETGDVFAFTRLIKKVGITKEMKEMILSKDSIKDMTSESFGYDFLFMLLDKASEPESEIEVYSFLAGPLEMEPEQVKKTDLFELVEMLKQVADVEKWKDFFTSAAGLTKLD